MVRRIDDIFPGLRGSEYKITGPPDPVYNCIAWAAGATDDWWWPVGDLRKVHWPTDAPREETLEAVQAAFGTLGYTVCDHAEPEPGYEKVALFANAASFPTHAARQLENGRWTSKIGQLERIEHSLRDLEGIEYGLVVVAMKRPA
ncbi:MAG TPA: hypothetical protein VND64_09135 [Pirellulales bacterium]|nr:hypothetical protein [Pirellulales bacterium]